MYFWWLHWGEPLFSCQSVDYFKPTREANFMVVLKFNWPLKVRNHYKLETLEVRIISLKTKNYQKCAFITFITKEQKTRKETFIFNY